MIPEYLKEIDLVALVESDLGVGESTGKWTKFNCPFCRGIRRDERKFLLVTNGDETRGGWWICKYCNKRGDVLAWLDVYRHLNFQDALTVLRTAPHRNSRKAIPAEE